MFTVHYCVQCVLFYRGVKLPCQLAYWGTGPLRRYLDAVWTDSNMVQVIYITPVQYYKPGQRCKQAVAGACLSQCAELGVSALGQHCDSPLDRSSTMAW